MSALGQQVAPAGSTAPSRLWWARWVVAVLALGAAAGMLWWVVAPRTLGVLGEVTVAYPVPDDPTATVTALYLVLCGVAGLLVGIPVVALTDRRVTTRLLVVLVAGLAAALLAYGIGFVLGPDPVAAQAAAHPGEKNPPIQVPLVLPTPLLALIWPAATSVLVTVGLLISGMLVPAAATDHDAPATR